MVKTTQKSDLRWSGIFSEFETVVTARNYEFSTNAISFPGLYQNRIYTSWNWGWKSLDTLESRLQQTKPVIIPRGIVPSFLGKSAVFFVKDVYDDLQAGWFVRLIWNYNFVTFIQVLQNKGLIW